MGMNYYANLRMENKKKIDPEKVSSWVEMYDQDLFLKLLEGTKETLTKIHIGKKSAGWKFIFNHNNWQYYQGPSEMLKFFSGLEIVNEYDEPVATDEFLRIVEDSQKISCPDHPESFLLDDYVFFNCTEFS